MFCNTRAYTSVVRALRVLDFPDGFSAFADLASLSANISDSGSAIATDTSVQEAIDDALVGPDCGAGDGAPGDGTAGDGAPSPRDERSFV